MEHKQIPGTALEVSPICLGTMTFGSPVEEADAVQLVHRALDHGVNFIDTANMYEGYARFIGSAGGVAEIILGKALAGRREEAIVATKVGMKVGEASEDEWTSAAAIRKHIPLSLRRMGTDYIDVYYLHKFDPNMVMVETLSALADAIRAGTIRCYGVSNYSAEQLRTMLDTADSNRLPRPVICQSPLSLLKQDILQDLLPLCAREKIAVAPYHVLQGGLLTGKYRRGQPLPVDSRKAEKENWVWPLTDDLFTKLEAIEGEARATGKTMTQYAIRWALQHPAIVSAIIGVKRFEQLEAAIVAASVLT